MELALIMQDMIYERKGIKMNIDGANAAILSDMGFNWSLGCGIFIIGRIPGILAHINEENPKKPHLEKFSTWMIFMAKLCHLLTL